MKGGHNIYVGACGFSYKDWVGPYYPKGLPKTKWLEFYASEFNCLELNSTHYAFMSLKAARSLASRVPAGFQFTIKLHKSLTHERESLRESSDATKIQNEPFASAGNLAVHLAQFPNSFRMSDANWDYIAQLSKLIQPMVVEFRNSTWQVPETGKRLGDLNVGSCCVDQPRLPGLMRWAPEVTSDIAYFRFHGRNFKNWYDHEEAFQRYDYLYSEGELQELAPAVLGASKQAKRTFAMFNNHYGAQAVTNARQLATTLGVETSPTQPSLFRTNP